MNSSIIQSVILGVVQGLGEFLPISSSAHLVLVPRYFGWPDPGLAFDVALHLGTLAAVVAYFWKDLARLATSVIRVSDPNLAADRRTALFLIIATIPGGLAGLALEHKAETVFRSAALIAGALIIMGLLLALADWLCQGNKRIVDLTIGSALGLGVAQAFALIPGVSRSGVTITLARVLGMERQEAARFSFLMSFPIIAGAGFMKIGQILHSPDKAAMAAGFTAAAISGFLAIWAIMRYVQSHRYTPFVIYRWVLGGFVLLNLHRFNP